MKVSSPMITLLIAATQLCVWAASASDSPGRVSSENDAKIYDLLQHDVEEAEETYKSAVDQQTNAKTQVDKAEASVTNAIKTEATAKHTALTASESLKNASNAEKEANDAVSAQEAELRRASEGVSSAEADLKRLVRELADKQAAASAAGLAFGTKQAERDQQKQALSGLQGLYDKFACDKPTDENTKFCNDLKEPFVNAKSQADKLDAAVPPLETAKNNSEVAVKTAQDAIDKTTNQMQELIKTQRKARAELDEASKKLEKAKKSTTELKDALIEAKNRVAEASKERIAAETRLAEAKAYRASVAKLTATAERHRNDTMNAVEAMEKIAKTTLVNACSDALKDCLSNTTTSCKDLVDGWAHKTTGWYKGAQPEWKREVDDCSNGANPATTMGVALALLMFAVSLAFA